MIFSIQRDHNYLVTLLQRSINTHLVESCVENGGERSCGERLSLIKWLIKRSLKMAAHNLQLMSQRESDRGSFEGKNM